MTVVERVVEVVVCLLALRPIVRHVLKLIRAGERTPTLVGGGLAIVAYVAAVLVCAAWFLPGLRVLAVVAAALIAHGLWRARSNYGSRRGFPPGSLAPAPVRLYRNQDFYLDEYASHGAVFKVSPAFRNPNVCIVGHDLARDVLRSNRRQLTVLPAPYNKHVPKGFLRYMGDDDHREYRRLFKDAMPPELTDEHEAMLRVILGRAVKRWAESAEPVAVEQAITEAVFTIMTTLFFGIGCDDPRHTRLRELFVTLSKADGGGSADRPVVAALAEIEGLAFSPPAGLDEIPASVLDRIRRLSPDLIDDPTIRRNLIYMVTTAHRDVAGLLVWVVQLLSDNRVWADRLRGALANRPLPLDSEGRSLADRVIMESLRLERSEYLYRRATRELRIGGYVIPKGWVVRICTREGHRTSDAFDRPNDFDPDRFLDRSFDRSVYAPFGMVRRRCLGPDIVAGVGRMFLEELLGPYDFEIVATGPPEFRAGHWQPSSSLRIRLTV